MVEILNDENFSEKVLGADGKIMVEFFATWCPHCQRMQPILEDVASKVEDSCMVFQVDVDQSPDLASKYAPNGFPTFVIFTNGVITSETTGEQSEARLLELAEQ